jgi:predicted RNase H-like HicB family nuclease
MKKETAPAKSKPRDTEIRDRRFGFIRSSVVSARTKPRDARVPVFIEKDEEGFYVVECPLFEGCYSQGETVDEALRNIREVIHLILEEKKNRDILKSYHPKELSLHTITL